MSSPPTFFIGSPLQQARVASFQPPWAAFPLVLRTCCRLLSFHGPSPKTGVKP